MGTLRAALVLTALTVILLGGVYPLAVWGIGHAAFASRSEGSLVYRGNTVVGSSLIGQRFTSDKYFHGRPSAAGKDGYDAAASGGSNLGPTSKALADRVSADRLSLLGTDGPNPPNDLLTTSASGLDPHISPEAARYQIPRVLRARPDVDRAALEGLIARHTEQRTLGLLGEQRVNVLALNFELDSLH
jgi:K+-transporting ATPase ATPase C chain